MSEEESNIQKPAEPAGSAPAAPAAHEIFRRYNVLMETSLTLSKLLLLATAFLTVCLSWLAGAELLWVAVRGAAATLAMGLALWIANWFFTRQVMETVLADAKQAQEAPPPAPVSTVEKRA